MEKGIDKENCNEYIPVYSMDGVVVSKINVVNEPNSFGYFIYSNQSPDIEAYIPPYLQTYPVQHGDWINFEVCFILSDTILCYKINLGTIYKR